MKVTYCDRWNKRMRMPLKPLSPERARHVHEKDKPYEVALEDDDDSIRIVQMYPAKRGCDIVFLDEMQRPIASYSFKSDKDGKRWFLCATSEHWYRDDEPLAWGGRVKYFKEDGSLKHSATDPNAPKALSIWTFDPP